MIDKLKNWLILVLAIIAGIFGISYSWSKKKKSEIRLKQAKEKIYKAGENIEEKHYNNADNAAKYIDNILSDISNK